MGKRTRGEDSQAGTAQRSRKNEAIRGLRIDDCQYQTVSFTPRTEFLNKRGEGPDAECTTRRLECFGLLALQVDQRLKVVVFRCAGAGQST